MNIYQPAKRQHFVFIILMMAASLLHADTFQTLLMPGEVIAGHEKYEQQCDKCHDTSDKKRQAELCVDCHEHSNIADDLANKTGFHGRLPAKEQSRCKHCHSEHKGRDENIILLNLATFDHQKTDFLLKGLHKKTPCDSCHQPEKKYADTASDCYSCHEQADVHDGKQGKKCGDCHSASGWKQTGFDHKDTDFELTGAHQDTRCSSCHINQKYKDTPMTCISCHQINDSHRGNFGQKCADCHNSVKWEQAKFDHDKETDFPLSGQHDKTACNQCHLQETIKVFDKKTGNKKLPEDCYSCHKNDDSHKTRYGKKCNSCHNSTSWQKPVFDHDKDTDFDLLGKHKDLICEQCHSGDMYKDKLEPACYDCHRSNDVHRGEQGKKCNSCHNENGWHDEVFFDHDLASFPLIGMHAATPCGECHLSAEYSSTESDCNSCHEDDEHESRLGTDCGHCHNPNAWDTWLFDHDKATDFKLDGAHEKLGCYDCHNSPAEKKLTSSKECISCHRSDDIHNRQFGRDCASCHSTKTFKDIRIGKQW